MSIQLESGVALYDPAQHLKLEFLGLEQVNGKYVKRNFVCGIYAFSNPYSANMFSYLYRGYGYEVAIATVLIFEQQLAASAPAGFLKFVQIDWWTLFRNGSLKLDWVGIVTELAVAAGGWAFTKMQQGSSVGEFNPYSPQQDGEGYVNYAIAYWKQNPSYGPAYKKAKF